MLENMKKEKSKKNATAHWIFRCAVPYFLSSLHILSLLFYELLVPHTWRYAVPIFIVLNFSRLCSMFIYFAWFFFLVNLRWYTPKDFAIISLSIMVSIWFMQCVCVYADCVLCLVCFEHSSRWTACMFVNIFGSFICFHWKRNVWWLDLFKEFSWIFRLVSARTDWTTRALTVHHHKFA